MRIQLSLDQNTLRFYGDETSTLRVDSDDDIVFAFPVITTDFVTSGQLRVVQAGRSQQYPLVNSQASVPASTLVSGPFTISAVSNLYSTNELEFTAVVSYTGNEMSPIVNKAVHLNENQINIYNEDNSQYIHFIMARYYDGVDLSTKTCRVHWYSPDNNVADYDAVQDRAVVGDNIVFTWLIGNELTQYEGEIQFVVEFIGTDYVWKSKICTFTVENSLADTGGLTPAPTDQWYNSFVVEMNGKVATAEAWATGQKSGTDVPDTDPAYQNNAKYYAEQAADEADRAEDAADHAEEVVDHKAEIDGYYQQMTVGNAEQLISSVTVNDKVPYNFRTSGGSIDIGNREVDKLVGGTVAWNQIIQNGNFSDGTGWGVGGSATASYSGNKCTITNTLYEGYDAYIRQATGYRTALITGHKYFLQAIVKVNTEYSGTSDVCSITAFNPTQIIKTTKTTNAEVTLATVYQASADHTNIGVGKVGAVNTLAVGDTIEISNFMCIDLTQMFGSTIADYIYSLETANAGAGVAWFKKLFPKDYYPYNAGQLMSVKALKHITTGFNIWDEEWEVQNNNNIRSKNYIPVLPNTTYYFKAPSNFSNGVFWYDADKTLVKTEYPVANRTYISPADARYMKFGMAGAYGTTYNHDICINLSWDGERDGEYEAYKKWTYPLDSDLELRGIPKLDASNNLYYDGDTYEDDGTVTRRYAVKNLGDLTYTYNTDGTYPYMRAYISDAKAGVNNVAGNLISSVGVTVKAADIRNNGVQGIAIDDQKLARIITANMGTDPTAFKTAMNGVYLVYELATPTTEEADPYQNPQIVDDFGTEEYVDERTVAIPVGHDTEYMNNLKAKLEMAPDSPDGDGDYIVRQTNGENSYVPLMKELPSLPTTDGTYTLKCTVTSGTATLGWVEEE